MKGVEGEGRERQSREKKPGRTREGEGGEKRLVLAWRMGLPERGQEESNFKGAQGRLWW